MPLTSDAKKLLAETIRGTAQDPDKGIRGPLLRAIHDEADRQYRLSVPLAEAALDEAHRKRRERIEAWIDERTRAAKPKSPAESKAMKERLLAQAEKEAAATFANRIVLLRHLEALGLSKPPVVTGGWSSKGYREFREFAPALCTNGTTDAAEGYGTLLQLLFDELAIDLPGLFGDVGLTRLFPIPAATLRMVVERLDVPELASAWTDDTTLGWVYQYWNDPDRELLDAKISGGGKIEPHEIASKTQMFTERYMVEWLLQNSLGLTWLAMCRKRGWKADAEQVLPVLDARRAEWRARRDAGEVALDALMPIEGQLEEHWKYFVPQPIPDDAVEKAPESVRAIKILDPACGSGHFLVIAFDLLVALYREEARHLGTKVSDREIAESILENNLHGIDIDLRAIQIAAAGLYLKAKSLCRSARPKRVNLVAPVLQLGKLPPDDPAVVLLRTELKDEVGIPEELTTRLLASLAGVDYLGSLLRVDAAVDDAISAVELELQQTGGQGGLFVASRTETVTPDAAKATILAKLERFLAKHSRSEDLGVRLDGEQLAAGVRFVRMAKEGTYDVVVSNPPYQGLSKTASFGYVATTYPKGKGDLYSAFLERGLGLVRPGGTSGMVTMQGWMFLGQFMELRRWVVEENSLRTLADLMWCAFENMRHATISMAVVMRGKVPTGVSVAIAPTDRGEREESIPALRRKRAAVLAQVGRFEFDPRGFELIDGEPIVYWWSKEFLTKYATTPKLGNSWEIRKGLTTCNNPRFVRWVWEVQPSGVSRVLNTQFANASTRNRLMNESHWVGWIDGAEGRTWFQELDKVVLWSLRGLEIAMAPSNRYGRGEQYYFRDGIAFSMIGSAFSGRRHRYLSIIGNMGASVYGDSMENVLCQLNSSDGRFVLQSLNPGIHFEKSDVVRLPVRSVEHSSLLVSMLQEEFSQHESAREPSVDFRRPGASSWASAVAWAQKAIDEPPMSAYEPSYDPLSPDRPISFQVGVSLGRFGAHGDGILQVSPSSSLPGGVLYLSSLGADSLDHATCAPLLSAWNEYGTAVGESDNLRTYLRRSFFDFHRNLYENRPIYFPLSSAKRSFVAFVSIHRWADDTLSVLLADHLMPARRRLEGEMEDLRVARAAGANKGKAEKRFAEVQKLLEELNDFIAKVTEIAEHGPPPPDDKTTKREVDARYVMDLDDGVMVNSAALWPLLEPQWKDPKKWWKELANAQGKKDYDWSHLAARYFPTRVREKCHDDPSLAVAHKCFWELHPAKAYAWELRLRDEIRPDFTIDEPLSDEARARFLKEHDGEAREILAKEVKRRERKKTAAQDQDEEAATGPLFEQGADDASDADEVDA